MILREDKNLLVVMHLCQLISLFTGIGGLLVPLIIWLTKKDEIIGMDEHGKAIVNFQISLIIYSLLCIPLMLLCGLGIVGLIIIGIIDIVLPIINAIKASNGEPPSYPFSLTLVQ